MQGLISPHGGSLVERVSGSNLQDQANDLSSIVLPPREQCDVEMMGLGAFSPLGGFMLAADYHSTCESIRLDSGAVWPIPITCSVPSNVAETIEINQKVALRNGADELLAILTVEEKYAHEKQLEAERVYGTSSEEHPGVAVVLNQGDVCLGGSIEVVDRSAQRPFPDFYLTPAQTRESFGQRGWHTVVAFQTRNPIHRAHEYLTKCALEICDGLLIHPLVGETQAGDIPPDVRMRCYKVLIERYYNPKHTMLAVMPGAMRYAGPREAILHAIIRQNYGCTHFIVGRDHAGVGNYYGTYAAQEIFEQFGVQDLAITPLKFEHSSWSKKAGGMVTAKTAPTGDDEHIFLSGTKVREMLSKGERPPAEVTRPEVADLLIAAMQKS